MSRHDYTKHSKKNQNEVNEVTEELEFESIEPSEDGEIAAEVENQVNFETEPTITDQTEFKSEPKVTDQTEFKVESYDIGVVTGCAKLRVRSEPRFGINVVCEIEKGTRVMIDRSKSTLDYYKIYTESGVEGFCVKDYIA